MNFKESLAKYLDENKINELLNSLNKKRSYCLLINKNKATYETLSKYFKTLRPHPFINNAYYYNGEIDFPGKSFLFDNGAYYIIDASSLLVSYFLNINDNDLILDMCAAPGGKSISVFLKNTTINLISNDLNKQRALLMSQNFERLGIANAIISSSNFNNIYQNYLNTFDKIILDAPCSGSGMFRKNNEMEIDWTYEKALKCSLIQKNLLEIAFQMLKNKGIISYSTCSFNYEENEEVILDFLKKHQDAKVINLPHINGEYRSSYLKEAVHLFPSLYEGEGMFICQIQKNTQEIETFSSKNKVFHNKTNYQKLYNLKFNYEEIINNKVYLYNTALNTKPLYVIKKGLLLGELKGNTLVPSFHLAHYLDSVNSYKLNNEQLKLYLHGDIIKTNQLSKNDYYIVSYDNINLGFVKNINGILKNFYPKGLRH